MSTRTRHPFTPGTVRLPGLALALLAGWLAPAPLSPSPARPAAAAVSSARGGGDDVGARHFRRFCARCHDNDLTGREGRDMGLLVPNFTSQHWQEQRSDAQVLVTILNGRGRSMPRFRDKLDEDAVRALVAFLRQSAPGRAPQADTEPGDFRRHFAELQREMEELQRQSRALSRPMPKRPRRRR
jgi:mono/diheme cytochrome c family protein